MKNRRSGGWVLHLSVLALFQWHMVQSIVLKEDKQPAPYALSPTYLQYLANQERKIYNAMKVYEEEMQDRLDLVKKYVKDYQSSTVAGTFHLDSEDERDRMVVQHPLLAFRMLSRFAKEFDAVYRHITAEAEKVVSEVVLEAKGDYGILPNPLDVEEAADAILRIQFVYALSSAQIANGQIPGGENIPVNLTTAQCYYIAKDALTTPYYTLALEWFDETRRRIKNDLIKENHGITESSLDDEILGVIKNHNVMYEEQFEDGIAALYSEKLPESVVGQRPSSTVRHDVMSRYSTTVANDSDPNLPEILFARNIALCNGQNIRPAKEESKLKCWLDRKRNPYWSILPVKIELLNDSPEIFHIHDFISDSWISELKKIAYADLWEIRRDDEVIQTAGFSWKTDDEISEVPLSRKIELLTGLTVRGQIRSSLLQVAAYALGGYIGLHSDSTQSEEEMEEEEERKRRNPEDERQFLHNVFTFLIYLNDVEIGGLTSFPKLGFSVKPEKGSAILFNTRELPEGKVDTSVLHGACPLIFGKKWIATKWISGIGRYV